MRHMSSSSSSWREKSGVGKPQWHRSPASTASDFSWNTAAVKHCRHTHTYKCITHERTHFSSSTLTFSVHMSTHLSTDIFWMTALKGSASVTLSGRWKHPLKMALPSEKQTEERPKVIFVNGVKKKRNSVHSSLIAGEHSLHQLGL